MEIKFRDFSNKSLRHKIEIETRYLSPGTVLKKDAYYLDSNGEHKLIFKSGEPITKEKIDFLKANSVFSIFYEQVYTSKDVEEAKEMLSIKLMEEAVNVRNTLEKSVKDKAPIPQKEIQQTVDTIISDISKSGDTTILSLLDLMEYDDYTYTHSVNVATLSVLFAKIMQLDDNIMSVLGNAAMVQDIGKLLIPQEITSKKGPLTPNEYSIIKKHPVYSVEILKKSANFSEDIYTAILQRHEYYDGSGYPNGIKGENMSLAAQILSIVSTFDSLISKRPYRDAYSVSKALIKIDNENGIKFSPKITNLFINNVTKRYLPDDILPVNSFVLLNTGEIAHVIQNSDLYRLKPYVEIIVNDRKEPLKRPLRIDLSKEYERKIVDIITNENLIKGLNSLIACQ